MPPASPLPQHLRLGRWAEHRAMWYLWRRGWRICARNWLGGGSELDIVASRWTTLLIVEVRYRRSHEAARFSVDVDKQTHLQRAAAALVREHKLDRYRLRFDLITVAPDGSIERRRDLFR